MMSNREYDYLAGGAALGALATFGAMQLMKAPKVPAAKPMNLIMKRG